MSDYTAMAKKYPGFFAAMDADVQEIINKGTLSGASKLAKMARCHFNASEVPQYFTGNLDAKLVLVHLNPKNKDNSEQYRKDDLPFTDAESNYLRCRWFGDMHYRQSSTHKSPFDKKQLRFLKQFGGIEFLPETNNIDIRENLARSIDNKLQLELVPYSSNNFSTSRFDQNILAEHKKRLLDVITRSKREHVLFCGSVFARIFGQSIVDTYQEYLPKKHGGHASALAKFSRLRIMHEGKELIAGLAHTYPQMGLNMEEYAIMCKKYY